MEQVQKIIVDLDAYAYLPKGWKGVEEHRKGGQFEHAPGEVALYLSDHQKGGREIKGHDLREELRDRPVFNANLLDWYLEHPEHILEEWEREGAIPFWGTIYRHANGNLVVRHLIRYDGQWSWGYDWLDYGFGGGSPAAVPASA